MLAASTSDAQELVMPRMITLQGGIVCETIEATEQAFDWAAEHPQAQYVDLDENPQCSFIDRRRPVVAMVQPLHIHENNIARVMIGAATPIGHETRYIWMRVEMKPQETAL